MCEGVSKCVSVSQRVTVCRSVRGCVQVCEGVAD